MRFEPTLIEFGEPFFLKVIKESFDQTLIKNQMKFALNDAVQLVWPCIS